MEGPAIAAMVGGTALQMKAANDAENRQERALANSLADQDMASQKAEGVAMQNAQEYAPEVRAQRFEESRTNAGESLAQQLTAARETVKAPERASGRLSEAFDSSSAKAKADQMQESLDMARAMGRVRGPQDMQNEEGFANADYASKLGIIGRNARGSAGAAQFGINAAGIPNSGQMALGGLAQGFGSASLSRTKVK
jgi:hypothetical protein